MFERWLPPSRVGPDASVATGTSVTSGSAGRSPRVSRCVRSAPATSARSTSFSVTPNATRTRRMSSSERDVDANARRAVSDPLSDVRGGSRSRERRRERRGTAAPGDRPQVPRRPPEERGEAHELAAVVAERLADERPRRRHGLRAPRRSRLRVREAREPGRHDVREERSHRDTVGERVMDLPDRRDAPAGEPFEEPELPERMASIERDARDPRDDGVHLARPPRRGHGGLPHVVVEIEIGILDPHGMMEAERYFDQATPERGQEMEPRAEIRLDARERVLHRGRGLEHGDLDRVHVERRRLHVEEASVDAGQALHRQAPFRAKGTSRRRRESTGYGSSAPRRSRVACMAPVIS